VRKFPDTQELAQMLSEAGFAPVEWEYLTLGIVALHIGRVPS
jgi:ubiquinone/menaquinone biosynthesis C-methylase UbiE